jgi:hypothetical protein
VEPTALACLGLLATGDRDSQTADKAACRAAAQWMVTIQHKDGAVPVSPRLASPAWTTPYAILLWRSLTGFETARHRACEWVLNLQGRPLPATIETNQVIGHDPRLIGWPWVDGTHSWLEPTALAILALCREGSSAHPRVRQGVGLILDRSVAGGGWNYGNKAVFGRALRPQPAPTGIALLALAARGDCTPAVLAALDSLKTSLPHVRAAVSLGWGVLGLRAHRAAPDQSESWLAEAYEQCTGRPDATLGLAILLLAAGANTMSLLLPAPAP